MVRDSALDETYCFTNTIIDRDAKHRRRKPDNIPTIWETLTAEEEPSTR